MKVSSNEAGYISAESEQSRIERLGYVSLADGVHTSLVTLLRNMTFNLWDYATKLTGTNTVNERHDVV